jgi:hypothetical protein
MASQTTCLHFFRFPSLAKIQFLTESNVKSGLNRKGRENVKDWNHE